MGSAGSVPANGEGVHLPRTTGSTTCDARPASWNTRWRATTSWSSRKLFSAPELVLRSYSGNQLLITSTRMRWPGRKRTPQRVHPELEAVDLVRLQQLRRLERLAEAGPQRAVAEEAGRAVGMDVDQADVPVGVAGRRRRRRARRRPARRRRAVRSAVRWCSRARRRGCSGCGRRPDRRAGSRTVPIGSAGS